ncbi:hypothetical protein [Paraglaciecola arctica]|uniref:hypothetical protein n=1 Tax=Paraglaciecola arctica TaxID=1128911 RepID=UPI001C07D1D0|nr:hypothetical protein [Paraglaciecola arctica]MBU3004282.1 hypothetical protein [Paraglaciecola arctica]
MTNKMKTPASKQLSMRLAPEKYDKLKNAAESKGISISDEAKERFDVADQFLTTKEIMRLTEARLKRVIFNMTCAVAGLNDEQILEAEARFVDISKNGVKREK